MSAAGTSITAIGLLAAQIIAVPLLAPATYNKASSEMALSVISIMQVLKMKRQNYL